MNKELLTNSSFQGYLRNESSSGLDCLSISFEGVSLEILTATGNPMAVGCVDLFDEPFPVRDGCVWDHILNTHMHDIPVRTKNRSKHIHQQPLEVRFN